MINCAEDPRVALMLTRYHSWPRLRDQSNGEHSAQILRILLTVWPDCPRKMLVHGIRHDMGEMAGDIQYPYKANNPPLKRMMDDIECQVTDRMSETIGTPPFVLLSNYEERVFKLVEFLEMWEQGLTEMGMGNKYARIIAMRCITAASAIMEELEKLRKDEPDIRPAVKRYVDKRTEWENQND